jgi:hypothetical protein
VETAFSLSFHGINHSLKDVVVDSSIGNVGIGLKTFLLAGKKSPVADEKIAQFDQVDSKLLATSRHGELIRWVINEWNKRFWETMEMYNLNTMMYHCVLRTEGRLFIQEYPMYAIDHTNLRFKHLKKSIGFVAGGSKYYFSLSKKTLYRYFYLGTPIAEIRVHQLNYDDAMKRMTTKPTANALAIRYA